MVRPPAPSHGSLGGHGLPDSLYSNPLNPVMAGSVPYPLYISGPDWVGCLIPKCLFGEWAVVIFWLVIQISLSILGAFLVA